jgi:hypothetical protein
MTLAASQLAINSVLPPNTAGENPIASTAPRNKAAKTQLRCLTAHPTQVCPLSLRVGRPV